MWLIMDPVAVLRPHVLSVEQNTLCTVAHTPKNNELINVHAGEYALSPLALRTSIYLTAFRKVGDRPWPLTKEHP